MKFSLRRLGALVGSAALALSLAACSNASSTSSASSAASIDYSACATDDSAEQEANVDRSASGSFPDVTGEDKPVIAAGTGAEPTTKALVKTLSAGDGAIVCPGAKVKVNYVGALWNGTVFDSSYERGEPAEFSLTQVVKGWTYGLAHARVGDRLEVVIPASLGYGSQPKGTIPANSTLVFVVDILGVGRQNIADPSVLSSGVATGEELPEGITVAGDAGAEPTLTIDESAGEALEASQTVLYKQVVGGFGANGQTQSSWAQSPLEAPVGSAELTGYTIGSRLLVVAPIQGSGQSDGQAQANVFVVDIVGTSSME